MSAAMRLLLPSKYMLNCLSQQLSKQGRGFHCGRACSSESAQSWDLLSAVCLERVPKLSQSFDDTEQTYVNMLNVQELENSVLSDHEIRQNKDKEILKKQGQDEDQGQNKEFALRRLAKDDEDVWNDQLASFELSSRTTPADEANDRRSLQRKLDSKLILLVKQKFGQNGTWCLPQGRRNGEESMREVAERVLRETCGEGISTTFMGNAPVSLHKYKYSAAVQKQTGAEGGKLFIFKSQIQEGQVQKNADLVDDYVWVTKAELADYLTNGRYKRRLDRCILEL